MTKINYKLHAFISQILPFYGNSIDIVQSVLENRFTNNDLCEWTPSGDLDDLKDQIELFKAIQDMDSN